VVRNSDELEKSLGKKFPIIKQCLSAFPNRRGRREKKKKTPLESRKHGYNPGGDS